MYQEMSLMNVLKKLECHLSQILIDEFKIDLNLLEKTQFSLNTDKSKQTFGDISANCALIISQITKAPPREIAEKIKESFHHLNVERIEIAGPGFLNFFLTKDAFKTLAQELYAEGEGFFAHGSQPKSYCVEFVSANPTGPLHFGHGRGGIIGDVLSHILSFLGHRVTKEFYINDAGNQIQKLGISFKIRCLQVAGQNADLPEDGYQGEYLVTLAQKAFNEMGNNLLVQNDEFYANYAKEHLLKEIVQTLKEYGIDYDVWFSEKTLHDSGAIEAALKKISSHLYDEDGALWLRTTALGDDKDRVVKKKTGELTYIAADIAYLQNKMDRDFDHLIYILGQDHHSYLQRLKIVMEVLGYKADRLDVILYQLVTIKESGLAVRLSKRTGRIITLDDIIRTVGKDVARFFYLHTKADAHLDFDIELALKHTDENPVYYIQYAYVRTKSIRVKAQQDERFHAITLSDCAYIDEPEWLLLKKIAFLAELLSSIEKNYQTHKLTYYAIELAQTFHTYYSQHKVIDIDSIEISRARLLIVELVGNTLKTTFELLGISAPERM